MSPDAPPLPLPAPELSIYRDYCIALLRRYFRMSVEVGRLPAILGRECFPSRARTYRLHSFEDAVVFVTDIDHCLDRLHPFDKELVARIVLQEYSEEEAARLLHCGLRTIERRLPDALDLLTEMFIRNRMLDVSDAMRTAVTDDNATSQCRDRVPQRATRVVTLHACAADSHFDTSLVKPPFRSNSPQATVEKENIILPDVAGLPPQSAMLNM